MVYVNILLIMIYYHIIHSLFGVLTRRMMLILISHLKRVPAAISSSAFASRSSSNTCCFDSNSEQIRISPNAMALSRAAHKTHKPEGHFKMTLILQ